MDKYKYWKDEWSGSTTYFVRALSREAAAAKILKEHANSRGDLGAMLDELGLDSSFLGDIKEISKGYYELTREVARGQGRASGMEQVWPSLHVVIES